jgi:DNA-binding LacI/PurR family transcriptional regulator
VRIAALACVTPETVARAYRSDPVRSTVAARIVDAARKLELPEPRIVVAP